MQHCNEAKTSADAVDCYRARNFPTISHDLPQILRARQARDGSKVDDLDMFGAFGSFTAFRRFTSTVIGNDRKHVEG